MHGVVARSVGTFFVKEIVSVVTWNVCAPEKGRKS
jgi:hypothetical protein